MKKKTELHPALSAMTTKEYDALWPKPPAPQGIRPLTPMVPCNECEKLKADNEALKEIVKAAKYIIDVEHEIIESRGRGIFNAIHYLDLMLDKAREMGVIE